MRRGSGVIALALVLSACAARSPTPTLSTRPALGPAEQLRHDLQAMFSADAVDHAAWSANFYSLRSAETLYSLNAGRFMVPASNQKLLTTAVAAARLGWDFRFTTRLIATVPIGADGTLQGDLVVTSNGDPSINPRHADRWRAFDDWAALLKAKGLRIINGRLIGDDRAFAEPGWGVGWAWDNLQYGYGAPPTALQFNENQIEVIVGPGNMPGGRAMIGTSPIGSGIVIDHAVTTSAAGGQTSIDLERVPGTALLTVRGHIAVDAKPVTLTASVDHPTRFYLEAFRETLARHGIFVAGGIADVDDLRALPPLDRGVELHADQSPTLTELIDVTNKWSRNIYAETLLLAMGAPGEPVTGTRALQALRETLDEWGIGPDFYLPRDGSGLSRYDYVTADAITWLLTYVWMDPALAERFQSTLPVAGISGSLANRMKGTPAESRVRAKTGTLSNVRALSGYVTTLEGETIVFSMFANDFRVPTAEVDAIMDGALNRVVQFRRTAPTR